MKDRINYYIFVPLILIAFFLETAFLSHVLWSGLSVPAVVIVLFASVFLARSSDFLYTAFIFGFLLDIYSGTHFGIFTASLVFSSIFTCYLKEKFLKEESFIRVVGVSVVAMLFYDLFYLSLLSLVFGAQGIFDFGFIGKRIFFDLIYAAVFIYAAMRLISNGKE